MGSGGGSSQTSNLLTIMMLQQQAAQMAEIAQQQNVARNRQAQALQADVSNQNWDLVRQFGPPGGGAKSLPGASAPAPAISFGVGSLAAGGVR